jgi:paraquat-inducible protein B
MKLSMDSLKLGPRENAVAEIAWFVLGVVSFDEPRYGNSSKCRRQSTWWLLLERLRRKKLPRLDVLQGCCYLGAEVKLMKVIQKVYLKSSNKTLQLQANYYSKEVLEVKPPTIWTEGKAEVGRVREEKRRRKKIREEKESEEKRCKFRKR